MMISIPPMYSLRQAVEECPPGAVLVIDSRKDARAASAGSILVARLMKRGVTGIVTDGGFRDSHEIATEKVLEGQSILGLYPATDERTVREFAAWRSVHKR